MCKDLCAHYKGGVTDLFLQLKIIIEFSVKNVTVAEKKIAAVCLQLNELGAFPDETVIDVLTGLTLFGD